MFRKTVNIKLPLNIDVQEVFSYLSEFGFKYSGPTQKPIQGEGNWGSILNENDMSPFFVRNIALSFEGTAEGFTTIITDFTPSELAVLFRKLPKDLSAQLTLALEDTELNVPSLSNDEILKITQQFKTEREDFDKLKQISINNSINDKPKINFNRKETTTVGMHEFTVTDKNSQWPVLGTFGAGPCVILTLYDKTNKKAVMAHIDALTRIDSLSNLLINIDITNTVAHLAGGNDSSRYTCIEIIKFLENQKIKIESANLLNNSDSMAIDSRTGIVYPTVHCQNLSIPLSFEARKEIAQSPYESSNIKEYRPSVDHKMQETYSNSNSNELSVHTNSNAMFYKQFTANKFKLVKEGNVYQLKYDINLVDQRVTGMINIPNENIQSTQLTDEIKINKKNLIKFIDNLSDNTIAPFQKSELKRTIHREYRQVEECTFKVEESKVEQIKNDDKYQGP